MAQLLEGRGSLDSSPSITRRFDKGEAAPDAAMTYP
jgi:hypothetical protein